MIRMTSNPIADLRTQICDLLHGFGVDADNQQIERLCLDLMNLVEQANGPAYDSHGYPTVAEFRNKTRSGD